MEDSDGLVHVLLIDDDVNWSNGLLMQQSKLLSSNVKIDVIDNFDEALKNIQDVTEYDLVFVDFWLGNDNNAFDYIEQAKSYDELQEFLIVSKTSENDLKKQEMFDARFQDLGVSGFVNKRDFKNFRAFEKIVLRIVEHKLRELKEIITSKFLSIEKLSLDVERLATETKIAFKIIQSYSKIDKSGSVERLGRSGLISCEELYDISNSLNVACSFSAQRVNAKTHRNGTIEGKVSSTSVLHPGDYLLYSKNVHHMKRRLLNFEKKVRNPDTNEALIEEFIAPIADQLGSSKGEKQYGFAALALLIERISTVNFDRAINIGYYTGRSLLNLKEIAGACFTYGVVSALLRSTGRNAEASAYEARISSLAEETDDLTVRQIAKKMSRTSGLQR